MGALSKCTAYKLEEYTKDIEKTKNYNIELEKAVLERTKQLDLSNKSLSEKNNELGKMNKELEAFAYVSSHDLQEPLRKLRAFGDRLSQRYSDQLDEQGQDYIRRMDNASERMQTLIDDILTYSRLSRNKDNRENVDLNQLITEVSSEIADGLDYDDVKLELENLPVIIAEPGQMRQLFQNLLSNAYKFKREGVEQHIAQCRDPAAIAGEVLQIAAALTGQSPEGLPAKLTRAWNSRDAVLTGRGFKVNRDDAEEIEGDED